MSPRQTLAFAACRTAVKAAVYDERGRECTVAAIAMAPRGIWKRS